MNGSAALKVDTNLKAIGVEASRPIKSPRTLEVMPLDADSITRKTAKYWTPFPLNPSPNRLLAKLIPFQHRPCILRINLNNKRKVVRICRVAGIRRACAFVGWRYFREDGSRLYAGQFQDWQRKADSRSGCCECEAACFAGATGSRERSAACIGDRRRLFGFSGTRWILWTGLRTAISLSSPIGCVSLLTRRVHSL